VAPAVEDIQKSKIDLNGGSEQPVMEIERELAMNRTVGSMVLIA